MTTEEQQQFIDEGPRLGETLVGSCPLHGPFSECARCALALDEDHITGAWVRQAIAACMERNLVFALALDGPGFVARASVNLEAGEIVAEGWADGEEGLLATPAVACYNLVQALKEAV